jgi:hypothetical protein
LRVAVARPTRTPAVERGDRLVAAAPANVSDGVDRLENRYSPIADEKCVSPPSIVT